ncbi:MAG: UbiD family decarboxylase [Candidatus ainarchaeum sp.]|nr:UbiD family decarboxylase [Candidatus ainarchaeum sp.]
MKFREFLGKLESGGRLARIAKPVSPELDAAAVIFALREKPVLFEKIAGSDYRLAAGICSTRQLVAQGIGVRKGKLLSALAAAIDAPEAPEVVGRAPCQEVIEGGVDLDSLPILRHFREDAGRYVTAAVAIIRDPETGRNACYHRLLKIGKDRFAARLVEGRQTQTSHAKALARGEELPVAFCIGNSTAVMLAASVSPPSGVDELSVANALEPTPLAKCKTKDLEVPADSEIVLEGRITAGLADEGPFGDLTETMDIARRQPVVVIDRVTHRENAICQTLLPGMCEHKLLMGMPREPTIFREVGKVCDCRNVVLTPGGASWFHAVVQIRKKSDDEPMRAIEAAFRGHPSLKHCVVVDGDIDACDPVQVEWAIATRFRADRRLKVFENQPSSSLDPMADKPPGEKARVAKAGIDATIPLGDPARPVSKFRKAEYGKVDLKEFV